ncbi:MAG: DUF1624 domain-containing protein [Clostridiales bacterium]|nr:DUF1624 domain-containing protein [Clostridiales bacterium]
MTAELTNRPRYALLDALRGFALVNMIAYHGLWDLIYLAGFTPGWYNEGGAFYWQQGICWTFILLSGFCWSMSRHPVRHGAVVFACGLLVTAVTALVEPTALIWWGVLSLLGAAGLLLTALEPLFRRLHPAVGLTLSALLFALTRSIASGTVGLPGLGTLELPRALYQNLATAFFGFPPAGFYSADYFPLLPWFFLFCVGYFAHRLWWDRWKELPLLRRGVPGLSWLGRHSLVVYLLHQPVLYGLLEVYWLLS